MTVKVAELDWRRALKQLEECREPDGTIPPPLRRAAAARLGITDRQLRRRMARPAKERDRALTDEQLAYLGVYRTATEAWRALVADGKFAGSLSTFGRRLAEVHHALHESITQGEEAMRDKFTYPKFEAEAVNSDWQQDTCWSHTTVLYGRKLVSPCIELIVDDRSRLITAVELWPREPDAELAATAVAIGVSGAFAPNRLPAKPKRIRHDQGAYYTGGHYSHALAAAGILPVPGSRRVARALGEGETVLHDTRDRLLLFEDLRATVIGWAHWYNTERPHSALGGRVPAQVYIEGVGAPPTIPVDGLRLLTRRPSEKRKTSKNGIRWEGVDYTAPSLVAGVVVDVAPRPHDPDSGLEVYRDAEWWCTAYPHAYWTSRMTAFYAERSAVAKRGRSIRRYASELRSRGVPSILERDEAEHDSLQDELLGEDGARWSA